MKANESAPHVSPVSKPRSRSWKAPAILAAVVIVMPAVVVTREMVAADKCVANGGSYDYLRALCDMTGGTYVPLAQSLSPFVWVGALLCLKLSAITLLAFWTPDFVTQIRSRIPYLKRLLPNN